VKDGILPIHRQFIKQVARMIMPAYLT